MPDLYAIGPDLLRYAADPVAATLALSQSVSLPGNGQYAVLHPVGNSLYVATGKKPQPLHVLAFAIDPVSGALRRYGPAVPLPGRAIHLEIDPAGRHLFVSLLDPGTVMVLRLEEDGTIGGPVSQPVPPQAGVFLHQARVTRTGRSLLVCARGNDATEHAPEDPGAIARFTIAEGVLSQAQHLDMPQGVGPRHLDFGPDGKAAYVAVERGNTLRVFALARDALDLEPLSVTTTLANPDRPAAGQRAGAIHVHPSGRFVYVSNRGQLDGDASGRQRFGGGENNIAVFALDTAGRQPVLVQHAPVHGLEPRSFAIDPSGRLLIAGNQYPSPDAPASLDVFSVGEDGRLEHKRAVPLERSGIVWVGFAPHQSGAIAGA
jgi:6-phosphogluconolactonase (cycloisomerase 2 family)